MDNALDEFFGAVRQEKPDLDIGEWLSDASSKVGQYSMSTHPPGFSHPDAANTKLGGRTIRTSIIMANGSDEPDGYIRSRSIPTRFSDIDAFGNAAVMKFFEFLMLILSDGRTVLGHILDETNEARQVLSLSSTPYAELRERFLSVLKQNQEPASHERIKQVYFPVGTDYHQLSLLTPSVLTTQMRAKINELRFSDHAKQVRELRRNNRPSETNSMDFPAIIGVKYGGTKPQNISYFNSKRNAGEVYYLSSAPPTLSPSRIRLPRRSFFNDCLRDYQFREQLRAFHETLAIEKSDMHLRTRRDRVLREAFSMVVRRIWDIRAISASWSDEPPYSSLPFAERYILDAKYNHERRPFAEEVNVFISGTTRWLVQAVKRSHPSKRSDFQLGDAETRHIENVLRQSREGLL